MNLIDLRGVRYTKVQRKTSRTPKPKIRYNVLEEHLINRGYDDAERRYEIDTSIASNGFPRFVSVLGTNILILGLHAGMEPVEGVVFNLWNILENSNYYMIRYNGVRIEDRLKSHRAVELPLVAGFRFEYVLSLHAMPDDWMGNIIAIGGRNKESRIKRKLMENLNGLADRVVIAHSKNGKKERVIGGEHPGNPVNYLSIDEGIQIEFPYSLLERHEQDLEIAVRIADAILSYDV